MPNLNCICKTGLFPQTHQTHSWGAHELPNAPPLVWSARQCRKNPVMVPQTAPAAGLGEPHDIRKGIIRRQGGRLPRCSIQRVGMGCACPCRIRPFANGVCFVLGTCINLGFAITAFSDKGRPVARQVRMTRHLGFREGRAAHSAGNTQTWPPNLCLPPPQEVRMMYASA